MTLQLSGAISFADIQTIFGGTNPIGMNEYYTNDASGFTTGVDGIPSTGSAISLQQFYGKAKPSSGSLYTFSSHTFTNAGATGRTGPIISQVRSAYSGVTWAQDNSYLSMTTQGIQEWTVPATGSYTFIIAGAKGESNGSAYVGGNGANITGTFNLTKGDVLCIVIGQKGRTGPNSGGAGGGGSFVYRKTDNLLYIVAGGGGGGGHDVGFGGGGSANQTPVNGGGSGNGGYQGIGYGGNGGGNSTNYVNDGWNDPAGGGGGWLSNGNNGSAIGTTDNFVGYGGYGRSSGFIGGYHGAANTNGGEGNGGFGGGGGSGGSGNSGGGGGGYTGGGGGNNWPGTGNPGHGGGQGGGSYNSGTNQTNTASANTGHGYVTITPNFTITGSLYTFTTHTFTNAGATGFSGPIISQVRSAYSGAAWAQNNSYLSMTTQGIQEWTVPATGSYTIRVAGAKGGDAKGYTGGSGRTVDATFTLTQNQVIKILIGQSGLSATSSAQNVGSGGGGGSFVINKTDNSILLIAGGGGGAKDNTSSGYNSYSNGVTAPYTNAGTLPSGGTGSTSGNGGGAYQQNWSGGGGGGFSGNGSLSPYGSSVGTDGSLQSIVAGISFTNGGLGGKGWVGNGWTNTGTAHGGFGGGGGCVNDGPFYPGGGGGYSGGDGTDWSTNVGGGGGGYYSNGTNTTNIGTNASNGYVTITKV
jgi:hypothetical protein